MYVFGACLLVAIAIGIMLIPQELNAKVSEAEVAELEKSKIEETNF